ncbi:MAG: CRISPR-associated endonuclease Cas2 [Bacteroidales bacterium]|nr:CRISPR-associated endonuclease Cas2 [Bacteroidales bacterium]
MLVLITYDVETTSAAGRRRLRQVAKVCVNYGQRVQNSVFECMLNASQEVLVRRQLETIIDMTTDNIRFYYLGNNWERRVVSVGKESSFNPESELII